MLAVERGACRRIGRDVPGPELDVDDVVARLRAGGDRPLGEALQDQRLVSGIGNMWMAEALWTIEVSPWLRVREVQDERCTKPWRRHAG